MSRQRRPNLPGVPFHVTARLQNREPLFEGLQREVITQILGNARVGRVSVVAYAVMPNHLHILVVQGERPLSRYMQPLLRQVALLIMKRWRREGHMFERRYHASPCLDPDYFRNAVAYIHLNPVRAGLCGSASDFVWTSHRQFREGSLPEVSTSHSLAMADALKMFAECDNDDMRTCSGSYDRYVIARRRLDAHAIEGGPYIGPALPTCRAGDAWWNVWCGRPAIRGSRHRSPYDEPRLQLRDIAAQVLVELAPGMDLRALRSGARGRQLVRIRRIVIARALKAGFRNQQIARYLDVSTTTVSAAACSR